ncbi:hypothetical protein CLU79DRAFT_725675 [Phycomyces nitens]|nr:hypothetical protein CLU79DRAFT_725675 [Phycomyces nitens]
MKSNITVLGYLMETTPLKWEIKKCFDIYRCMDESLSASDISSKVQEDLDILAWSQPQQATYIALLKSTLNTFEKLYNGENTVATNKIADQWKSHSKVTINQLGNQSGPSSSVRRKSTDSFELGEVAMKKTEKKYHLTPQMKSLTSTQKPHISTENCNQLSTLYSIKISEENMPDTPADLIEGYEQNKENQASNASLHKRPIAFDFLKSAIDQPIENIRQYLWTHGYEDDIPKDDKKFIDLIRLVLTDFWSISVKPEYPSTTNERTPFVESIVPIFKYLSAIINSVAFVWGEKGLSICMPQHVKLMDGIGTTLLDDINRILIEYSGQVDGSHTEEDTLKLLEYTSVCLQEEKSRYQQASHITFTKKRTFGIQVVGHKITLLSTFVINDGRCACLWERSALIPSRWNQRKYWVQAFEFIARLMVSID